MPVSATYRPARTHEKLGEAFYDPVDAAAFAVHILRFANRPWAQRIGLGDLTDAEWIDHFGRFTPLPDTFGKPLALRYHGHQFRSYNPDLGDGRGFLFAQAHDAVDGRLLDLATKGSGRTPWSRTADGRLTLKGGVREILATEMLEALGVETSKSLSLVETGESLVRYDEPSPTRGSVLVRLSHSHIRIGTFQRLRYLDDTTAIAKLVDHCVQHYLPEAARPSMNEQAAAFLEVVCARVARMGAQWMAAGFVHGVLNTDNINITGESFDYGPWRFLPVLDPAFTAAYFDETGLYAFGRQPDTLLWNLTRLAECLLPLTEQTRLEETLRTFETTLRREFANALLRRLGLASSGPGHDAALVSALWGFLQTTRAPFEQVLFDLHGGAARLDKARSGPAGSMYVSPAFADIEAALGNFAPASDARIEHAYFAGDLPCTMLIEEVEALWAPIAADDDWRLFEQKIEAIRAMGEAYGIARDKCAG